MHYGQAILRHEKNQISLFFGALPSHAHLDTMSFEIWARGEYFSPDPACGPGHASELHTQWYSQTRSHNAVTFDELSYGIHRKAELVSWDGHSVKVRGEIHPGCFLTRRVSIAGDTFWFRDVVTGKKPEGTRKLIWRFNTFARPRIESGAVVLQERPDGPKVVIQTHREAVFSVFHCKLNRSSEEHEEAHQVRFEIPAEARELVFEVSAEVR
jgi:hypothetical protein